MLAHIRKPRQQIGGIASAHVHERVTIITEPFGFARTRSGVFQVKKQTRIRVRLREPTLLRIWRRKFHSVAELTKHKARSRAKRAGLARPLRRLSERKLKL